MVENPFASAGDMDFIPRLGRSPGVGNDNPLQHSYLKNSMARGAWSPVGYSQWGCKESDMSEHFHFPLL